MQSIQRFVVACSAIFIAATTGCTSTTSTISGTIQQESFPAPVTKITVRTEKADRVVPVDAAGKFQLVLQQGAEYQFLFSVNGKEMPLIARSIAGRLDTTVQVRSGGAKVDMGNVTYFAGQSATALSIPPPLATAEAAATCEEEDDNEEDGDNNQCENGLDPNGNACDGGPAANQDDGQVEETDSQSSDEMALPQYNLPGELGCEEEDDDEETDDD